MDCVFPGHDFVLENWGEAVKEGKNVWREILCDLQRYDWELDLEDFQMELVFYLKIYYSIFPWDKKYAIILFF